LNPEISKNQRVVPHNPKRGRKAKKPAGLTATAAAAAPLRMALQQDASKAADEVRAPFAQDADTWQR
jgi:hypothetical protein